MGEQALDLTKGWLGTRQAMAARPLISGVAALAYHLATRCGGGDGFAPGRSLGEEYTDLLPVDSQTLGRPAPRV